MRFFLFCLGFWASTTMAEPVDAVLGLWASEGSIIEISESGGTLQARVVALKDAVYREGESGAPGTTRLDDRNPDPALRTRSIVGIDLLSDYAFAKGQWQGRIYDPESGNVYSSRMKVEKDGRLHMRGYIGVPMLGRTAIFDPVASCQPHIVAMLAMAALSTPCG